MYNCIFAVYLSGVLLNQADGVCSDAVKYISKEELHSATIINTCDQYGSICSKEEQTICTAQWRRMDGSSNSECKSAYIDPNNRTHYRVLDEVTLTVEFCVIRLIDYSSVAALGVTESHDNHNSRGHTVWRAVTSSITAQPNKATFSSVYMVSIIASVVPAFVIASIYS